MEAPDRYRELIRALMQFETHASNAATAMMSSGFRLWSNPNRCPNSCNQTLEA